MKKIFTAIMTCILVIGMAACANNAKPESEAKSTKKHLSVVSTIFPEYDWVKEVLGSNPAGVETTMLINKGVDLHSYQPSVDDIAKIKDSDYFIYVGGESDAWVKDALHGAKDGQKVLNLVEALGDKVYSEEVVEGMQDDEHEHDHEHEHEHEHDADHDHKEEHDHDHEHEHEEEYDEHVWLSLRNAQFYVQKIAATLGELDPENKDFYATNAKNYIEKLIALDRNMIEVADQATTKTVLFGDRFPFRYFVEDYGLHYYAAFVGCSAETEASFETLAFLAGKVDELGLHTIFTIENSDGKIANAVKENTKTKDQDIAVLNSLQSVKQEEADAGASYLKIMENNVETLRKALVK